MKQSDKENLLNIQYLDNHLLVVVKKANLLTQPNGIDSNDLESEAQAWIKQEFNKKTNVFLHPIHRLDKEVSGLVVFARTSKSLSRLNEQMRQRKILRKYLAEIEGKLTPPKTDVKNYIKHASHRAIIVKKEMKDAKLALLSYKVIEEKQTSRKIEIELKTGRYHQIRAQFANMNHPILGDIKYGAKKELKKVHLCCSYLEFLHPTQNKVMKFQIKSFF